MAACSVFVPYPIQHSSEMMESRGNGYIRDEIVFSQPRCNTTQSNEESDVSSDRRASLLQEYFKSTNALTRSIMLEKSTVENEHRHNWTVLSDSRRDEIVNDHFVPSQVREQYEGGMIGNAWRPLRSNSRLSTRSGMSLPLSQVEGDSGEWTDGGYNHYGSMTTLSQPDLRYKYGTNKSKTLSRPVPEHHEQEFTRNKLRSFSFRSKKGSPVSSRQMEEKALPDEIVPLFERDVNDLDNDVDLPDESLLTDHVDTSGDSTNFARLKPLRYSFGRKLRHKVDLDKSSSDLSSDYVITNINIDSASMQDLSEVGTSSPELTDSMNASPELSTERGPHLHLADMRSSLTSPVSDDTISIVSRQSMRTPDPTQNVGRGKLRTESPLKHPLSRSVRAGSSYMTVTSEFADRRQMFKGNMKKKANSTNTTRENTPVPSEVEQSAQRSSISYDKKTGASIAKAIPMIKTDSVCESAVTNYTNSTGCEQVSPICSPPASPAAHGPIFNKSNKRESGYMSSTEDDEEGPRFKQKRRSRMLQVERSVSPLR